jgi:homoserine O-acetyltransferase
MIASQYRLVTEHFGITHLAVVTGASMGGMQSLQWAVSHPTMMDRVVAITPLAHTPAWTLAVTAAARMAFTLDPAFNGGNYTKEPEGAWRLQSAIFDSLITRTPVGLAEDYPHPGDVLAFAAKAEDARVASGFDANDWISQTWAYDRHNVGDTPGFNGDYATALTSVKAKTLILQAGLDLLNPAYEGNAAAKLIPYCVHVMIPSNEGHSAGGPLKAADVDFMNATITDFLAGKVIPNS